MEGPGYRSACFGGKHATPLPFVVDFTGGISLLRCGQYTYRLSNIGFEGYASVESSTVTIARANRDSSNTTLFVISPSQCCTAGGNQFA